MGTSCPAISCPVLDAAGFALDQPSVLELAAQGAAAACKQQRIKKKKTQKKPFASWRLQCVAAASKDFENLKHLAPAVQILPR